MHMISPASSDLMNSAVPHGSVEVLSGCTRDLLRHRGKPVFVLYVFDIRAACLRTYWGEWRCDRCRKAFPTLASVLVLLLPLAKRSMRCSVRLGERCNSQENALRTCVDQASSETLFGSVRDMFRFVHGGSKSLRVVLWCSHQDLKSTGEGFVLIAQQCAAIFLSETI
jgi:hypothetical protein